MTYRFPLQRLLDLRQQHEHAMARALVSARDAADEELRTKEALQEVQELAQDHVARVTTEHPTIGTLMSLSQAMHQLEAHVVFADERLRAADAVVQKRHDALTVAAQARQILDRLRKRHETAFRSEESARDLHSMDEIALTRFTQPDQAATSSNRTKR